MKIQGLPHVDSGIRNIAEKKQTRTTPVESAKTSDTVELSGGGSAVERGDAPYVAPLDFPVRSEVVRAVAERISRNDYNKPETQESVAVSIINSLGGTEPADGAKAPEFVPERTERVQSAQVQANGGYYNRPEVLNAIAERLIGTQGLSGLSGR